jgi:surface protein
MVYQFTNTDTSAFSNYTRGSTTTAELPYYSATDEIPDWTLKHLTTGVKVDGSGKILTGLENGSRYEVAMFVDAGGDAGLSWWHNGSGNATSHIRKNTTNVVIEFGTMPLGRFGSHFREYGGTFSSTCGVPVIKPGTSGLAMFYRIFQTSLGVSTDDPNSFGVVPGLADWDVSNLTDFTSIFREARLGTVDLSSWTFPLVQNFTSAFSLCDSRFSPIGVSTWDMSNVKTLTGCFYGSPADGGRSVLDNVDVTGWDVSSVTIMQQMFRLQNDFNQDIGGWNTMSVTLLDSIFRDSTAFNQNLSSWDVSKVIEFKYMFSGCTAYNQDIIGWDVTATQNRTSPFHQLLFDCPAFNGNVSNWTFGSSVELVRMFGNCPSFQGNGLETWDFSAMTSVRLQNFSIDNVAFNPDLSSWDVSTFAENMRQAFLGCAAFNSDISSWNVSNVTNMALAFKGCASFNQDISSWNTSSVTNMENMFNDAVLFNYDMTAFIANSNSANTTDMFLGATAYSF